MRWYDQHFYVLVAIVVLLLIVLYGTFVSALIW